MLTHFKAGIANVSSIFIEIMEAVLARNPEVVHCGKTAKYNSFSSGVVTF